MAGKLPSIYGFPLYYDILFGWDRDKEAGFYDAAFRHYGAPRGGQILEVACGTGQVGIRLARMGWKVTGLDLSGAMLEFLGKAARAVAVTVDTFRADMTDFSVSKPFAAAFSPLGSISILQQESAILSHFHAVAEALLPGGIYVVDNGFYENPKAAADPADWTWSMTRDNITVESTRDCITVRDGGRVIRLSWEPELRRYSSGQFAGLIEKSGRFSIEAWHPDLRESPDGLSTFDVARTATPGNGTRGMLVLQRTR